MTIDDMKMLNIVVFPWLAFGHLLPFFNLSKYLASKGHDIAFLSTPRNLERLPKIPPNLVQKLTLVPISLPQVEGLPPNAEATTDVPSDMKPLLRQAYRGLAGPVASYLKSASRVDWIIHDLNPWIGPIVDQFGIKKAFFITTNAWTISVVTPSHYIEELQNGLISGPKPNNEILRQLREAKQNLGNCEEDEETWDAIKNCDVIIIRTCVEFEAESLKLLEMLHNKPVVPTGLMPVFERDNGRDKGTWPVISGWLDKHGERSVAYVALGSETSPSREQITELALGLELSNSPFIWAFRKPMGSSIDIPDGFEERTRDRGLVWTEWAPQLKILAHNSVGAFLTHCGCSSVIEGLQFGKPLMMLPFWLDQILNAKNLAKMKIGVEITKDRNSIADSVELVLQGEDRNVYKENAVKMSGIVADQGLQSLYLEKMEEFLTNNY